MIKHQYDCYQKRTEKYDFTASQKFVNLGGTISTDTIDQWISLKPRIANTTTQTETTSNNVIATNFPNLCGLSGGNSLLMKTKHWGFGEKELLTRLLSPGCSFFSYPMIIGVENEGFPVYIGQPHDYSGRNSSQPLLEYGG